MRADRQTGASQLPAGGREATARRVVASLWLQRWLAAGQMRLAADSCSRSTSSAAAGSRPARRRRAHREHEHTMRRTDDLRCNQQRQILDVAYRIRITGCNWQLLLLLLHLPFAAVTAPPSPSPPPPAPPPPPLLTILCLVARGQTEPRPVLIHAYAPHPHGRPSSSSLD